MKTKLVYALAGAIALGFTTFSQAEDKPEGRPQRGNYSPEQREKFAKELGLNPDELKNLSPQERMAKVKEASEKKLAELQKKKADGTITEEEKQTLQRMEAFNKMREQRGAGGGAGGFEDREKMVKELGLNPDDLKKLSPEERGAKIREAAKAKLADLQKKQTDGTISDSEKETLKRLEERQKQMANHGEHGAHHGDKGGKPSDEKK